MEQLITKATEKTPEINFNPLTGKLFVGGRSYSSQSMDFYKTVNDWLTEYVKNPAESTTLEVNVDYFHSVSLKYLTSIVRKVSQLNEYGKNVKIKWYHQADENDEDEALELGKSIETQAQIKLEFVEISN